MSGAAAALRRRGQACGPRGGLGGAEGEWAMASSGGGEAPGPAAEGALLSGDSPAAPGSLRKARSPSLGAVRWTEGVRELRAE